MNKKIEAIELIYDISGYRRTIVLTNEMFCNIKIKNINKEKEIHAGGTNMDTYSCDGLNIILFEDSIEPYLRDKLFKYLDMEAFYLDYSDGTREMYYIPIKWYYKPDNKGVDNLHGINTLQKVVLRKAKNKAYNTINICIEGRK